MAGIHEDLKFGYLQILDSFISNFSTIYYTTRWWFQIFLEFSPLLGEDSHFD